MRKQRQEFCTVESSVSIFAGTWNVAGKDCADVSLEMLRDWLLPMADERCDIYAVAFQETVDLNAVNVVMSSALASERVSGWKDKIAALLRAAQLSYSALYCQYLVGTALLVFVRSDTGLLPRIKAVRGSVVATGAGGLLGNKGAVVVRFKIDATSFCLLSTHLSADRDRLAARNHDVASICERCVFAPVAPSAVSSPSLEGVYHFADESRKDHAPHSRWFFDPTDAPVAVDDHDVVLWLGDLNYRIDASVPDEEVFAAVCGGGSLAVLRENDQLLVEMAAGQVFKGYCEGELTFLPTYKYEVGSHEYARKKVRFFCVQAWPSLLLIRVCWYYTVCRYGDACVGSRAGVVRPRAVEGCRRAASGHRPSSPVISPFPSFPLPMA